jgi:hypothetical protein
MKKKFQPFSDDSTSLSIGEFTIENGTDKVALCGSLDVMRDKDGLKQAKALKAVADAIVEALEQDEALSDESGSAEAPQTRQAPRRRKIWALSPVASRSCIRTGPAEAMSRSSPAAEASSTRRLPSTNLPWMSRLTSRW